MDKGLLRILDANANRAREALRVLEDAARFALNDTALTETLKKIRHDLAATLALLPMSSALQTRDTPNDVGTAIKTESEFRRESLRDISTANAKRLSESLRSLEECAKFENPAAAQQLEQLRYRCYEAERVLQSLFAASDAQRRFENVHLYVLLTADMCKPAGANSDNREWEKVLDDILSAASAKRSGGGISPVCVQLREKNLPDAELLRRARIVVEKCHAAGALAIINDRVDIAMIAQADGVHVGQSDLSPQSIRGIMGPAAIIGISTENLDQAKIAVAAGRSAAGGATYVAVGPMFTTTTKHKTRIVGPTYAAEAVKAIPLPIVAIGGITPENIAELTAVGIKTVAVSAAVLRSTDPGGMVRTFLQSLPTSKPTASP